MRNDTCPTSLLFGQSRSMFLSYFFLPAERRLLPASLIWVVHHPYAVVSAKPATSGCSNEPPLKPRYVPRGFYFVRANTTH